MKKAGSKLSRQYPYYQMNGHRSVPVTPWNKREVKRTEEMVFNKYNKNFKSLYGKTNENQQEILINALILFALMVIVSACFSMVIFAIGEFCTSKKEKTMKEGVTARYQQAIDNIPMEPTKTLLQQKINAHTGNSLEEIGFRPLNIVSDLSGNSYERSTEKLGEYPEELKNNAPPFTAAFTSFGLNTARAEYKSAIEISSAISVNGSLVEELNDVIEDGNLSAYLAKNFKIEDVIPFQTTKGYKKHLYPMRELLRLRPPLSFSPRTPAESDASFLDLNHIYSKKEILSELQNFTLLTKVPIKSFSLAKSELYLKEINEIFMNQAALGLRTNNEVSKVISIVSLVSIGANSLCYKNPNMFVGSMTNLMSSIIESGAIFDLFKIEKAGGYLISLILEYVYCHWHYHDSDTTEIDSYFNRWSSPVVVQRKFFLFKYLITLKMSGVTHKIVDKLLLYLELKQKYVVLINEAMKITEDAELLNLLYCLKRKCTKKKTKTTSGSPAAATFHHKQPTMPGTFT